MSEAAEKATKSSINRRKSWFKGLKAEFKQDHHGRTARSLVKQTGSRRCRFYQLLWELMIAASGFCPACTASTFW